MTFSKNEPMPHKEPQATILIVDDEPANLMVLSRMLQADYRVRAARSGEKALLVANTDPRPDLVLLDIMMPEMDGYTVLARLRENEPTANIPVIFVTALSADEDEQHGLELGAVDYISKPVRPAIALARVQTQLALKVARDQLGEQNNELEAKVKERTQELEIAMDKLNVALGSLQKSYYGTLQVISSITELRGGLLGDHSRRVAYHARQVANLMVMSDDEVQKVFVAALLHDIGKIGFPDEILNKPIHALNREQATLYRQHPVIGADALARIDTLSDVAAIVRYHHEHYDGSGFPEGLRALDIPLGARIIAAVSDYDDLINGGQSSFSSSSSVALRSMVEGRNHRYDPDVIVQMAQLLSINSRDSLDAVKVTVANLQDGMQLARDLIHPDGYLLMSKSTVISRRQIRALAEIDRKSERHLEIYVMRPPVKQ